MDSTTSAAAAPSSSYDVFLSFRGEDTRNHFTGHLYNYLNHKGIRTFKDDEELRRGEELSPALLKAIEESKLSVIVFSENYASSKWCLEELGKILECKASRKQMVFPIFYKVDPSIVRNQRGNFAEAFAKHEGNSAINKDKVLKWRTNLTEAANVSGWTILDGDDESKFIDGVVKEISKQVLNRTYFNVAENPVGIESRVQDVKEQLDVGRTDYRMVVGIWGTGGIGKTTIAKAVYNSIAHNFEGSCFLANVREEAVQHDGLVKLQNFLLNKILGGKECNVINVDQGITVIRERLRHKRVLLILDDVSKLEQLKKLIGSLDWFGSGSRVIITTRHKDLLTSYQVSHIYNIKELDSHDALELFTSNAFKGNRRRYLDLDVSAKLEIDTVVNYAHGLPLALIVLGSLLRGRSINQWKDILDSQRRFPNEEIQGVLKISFNDLGYPVKQVFLDIACFFKGWEKDYVIEILQACVSHPGFSIDVLIEKALITIDDSNSIWMHDLLEDMGKELVRQESPTEAGERSRVWLPDDVEHVLTDNTGTNTIRGMTVNFPEPRAICLTAPGFLDMKNLRFFINYDGRNARFSGVIDHLPNTLVLLDWPEYPFQSLPSNFYPKNLVVLNMRRACVSRLWDGSKHFEKLTYMDLSYCESLTKTPDFSGLPNLVNLSLIRCTSLVEVDDSVGSLTKLAILDLVGCYNLATFPTKVKWKSIKSLNFGGCQKLKSFPEFQEKNESLCTLDLSHTGIQEVPPSIANLTLLQKLSLSFCKNLTTLPHSLYSLQHVEVISLTGCSKLVELPRDKEVDSSALSSLRFFTKSAHYNLSYSDFPGRCRRTLQGLRPDKRDIVHVGPCSWVCEGLPLPRQGWVDASECVSMERFSDLSDFFEDGNSRMFEYTNGTGFLEFGEFGRNRQYSMAKNNPLYEKALESGHNRKYSMARKNNILSLSQRYEEFPRFFNYHIWMPMGRIGSGKYYVHAHLHCKFSCPYHDTHLHTCLLQGRVPY